MQTPRLESNPDLLTASLMTGWQWKSLAAFWVNCPITFGPLKKRWLRVVGFLFCFVLFLQLQPFCSFRFLNVFLSLSHPFQFLTATEVRFPPLEVYFWCCSNSMEESLCCWFFPAQVPSAVALASCLQMILVPLHWSHPVCWIWYCMSLCVANGNVSALDYMRGGWNPGDSHLFMTELCSVGNNLWKTLYL